MDWPSWEGPARRDCGSEAREVGVSGGRKWLSQALLQRVLRGSTNMIEHMSKTEANSDLCKNRVSPSLYPQGTEADKHLSEDWGGTGRLGGGQLVRKRTKAVRRATAEGNEAWGGHGLFSFLKRGQIPPPACLDADGKIGVSRAGGARIWMRAQGEGTLSYLVQIKDATHCAVCVFAKHEPG